jgi:hypothetical protein
VEISLGQGLKDHMLYLLSIFYIYERKREKLEREGDGKSKKKEKFRQKKT